MNRIFCLFVAAGLCTSCGLHEIGGGDDIVSDDVWGGPVAGDNVNEPQSAFYMTVLDYKDGYDWRSDLARENVKCSLVVYVDGIPAMKVPVGEVYDCGSDPDMHRLIGGHLYSDFSAGGETIVRKNGKELFRYDGNEFICGMEVVDNDVYTLGQDRDGSGFSFRKNGDIVAGREEGIIVGGLHNDCDSLCFAFLEQVYGGKGSVNRYYMSVNGRTFQVAVRDDIEKVWDVAINEGQIVFVASLVGIPLPVLSVGESMTTLPLETPAEIISCSLLCSGDRIGVEVIYRSKNGAIHSSLWLDGKHLFTFGRNETIAALGMSEGGVFCAVNSGKDGQSGTIYRCGEVYEMPRHYVVMGDSCMAMVNGILHVGLSSVRGERPLVWKDGRIDTLQVNGYISSVSSLDGDLGQSSHLMLRD